MLYRRNYTKELRAFNESGNCAAAMKLALARRNAAAIAAAALLAALSGCAPRLGPPPGSAAAPDATPASAPAQTRDEYIIKSLVDHPPAGVGGRHLVGIGTGFYVAGDEVLTKFHVAGACGSVTVGNDTEGAETVATLVAGDQAADLALLRTAQQVADPARFAAPPAGEAEASLTVVGYPEHGLPVRIAELAPVSARPRDIATAGARYPFDGAVRHGNSGSPVLDADGGVLGVVVQKVDTVAVYQKTGEVVDKIGIAISNRMVEDFLRANGVAAMPAAAGAALTPAALLDRAHGFVRQVGCWR